MLRSTNDLRTLTLVLLLIVTGSSLILAAKGSEEAAAEHDLAAEEAAAAAVGEVADEEAEDEADALDEDADSARLDPNRHPLWNMPPSAGDVDIGYKFAAGLGEDKVLTLGDQVQVLIAFSNAGRSLYHIWGVMGSLNMHNNFNMYVQNFSYHGVNKTVSANKEMSLWYKFTPNERLDTRKFQLALSVFYEAQSSAGNAIRGHSTTFFNETVGTVAGEQSIGNTTFMIILVLCIAGAVAVIVYLLSGSQESKKAMPEMGTDISKENEWLEEHSRTMQSGGGRSAPSKKK